jgi:hypothetical protein
MTLKEFGNSLESTPFWKEGLVNVFFGLLPVFLVGLLLATFWINRNMQSKFWKKLVYCTSQG